jgi:benzoylformate decarboxylase
VCPVWSCQALTWSLATGYGCAAARPTTADAIAAEVAAAFQRQGPSVLQVPIDPAVPPLL